MTRRRVSRLFRLGALLATCGMLLGWIETIVPDVHDGHVAAAESVAFSHDHVPASPDAPGHAPQSPHTCHCIHAHTPAMPARLDDQPRLDTSDPGFSSTERALASVAPEPHFRPPVA